MVWPTIQKSLKEKKRKEKKKAMVIAQTFFWVCGLANPSEELLNVPTI